MVNRNPNIGKLKSAYIFPEIREHVTEYLNKNPSTTKILNMGIGDTTEPLTKTVRDGLENAVKKLSNQDTYTGYGPASGNPELREKISKVLYNGKFSPDEIFVSDGAKCDLGRLQTLFGSNCEVAVQDPAYPAYVDAAVILGQTGNYDSSSLHYTGIHYLPCTPENNFIPDLSHAKNANLIIYCSPFNPTGSVASREELQTLVDYATSEGKIILFDSAYASFVRDASLPKSIFEIEGAEKVSIEVGSFSKWIGFTGVRLGWSVVPKELLYQTGESVLGDWKRVVTTIFNGASNISQAGGIAALSKEGLAESSQLVGDYLKRANKLKTLFKEMNFEVYGGENAPYIWIRMPGMSSWQSFNFLLEKAQIVSVPGCGFGKTGEGFLRLSAFASEADIEEACHRLKNLWEMQGSK